MSSIDRRMVWRIEDINRVAPMEIIHEAMKEFLHMWDHPVAFLLSSRSWMSPFSPPGLRLSDVSLLTSLERFSVNLTYIWFLSNNLLPHRNLHWQIHSPGQTRFVQDNYRRFQVSRHWGWLTRSGMTPRETRNSVVTTGGCPPSPECDIMLVEIRSSKNIGQLHWGMFWGKQQ